MAISSPGIGTGLDVNSIISQLMSLERQPLTTLGNKETAYNNQISALGKIKSAISSLKTAAADIASTSKLYSYKATVADTTVASATTTSSAVGGTYSLEVTRLASTHKLVAAAAADPSAGGTLTISIGSTATGSFVAKSGTSAVPVTIAAGASMADVRDAINAADAGVTATIVNGADGPQLVVTSKNSGETNQIKIEATAGLSGFSFDPVTQAGGLTQKDPGQDAIVKIDGITIKDTSSNTVTDAITGVTLNLLKTNSGSPTQLTIANDPSNLKTKVEAFVKAYNELNTTVKDLTKYDSTTKKAGTLNNDSSVRSLTQQIRDIFFTIPSDASSAYPRLGDLGIRFQSDGSLALDSTVLQTAMDKDFSATATTLAAYGTALSTATTSMLSVDGLIATKTDGINSSLRALQDRKEAIEQRLTVIEKRYRAQFASLDAMIGQMQTTSSYLTQQLASLNASR